MRLLVVSDSHSYLSTLEDILKRERSADLIIHLGDHSDDMSPLTEYTAQKGVIICRGNCDIYGYEYAEQHVFEADGKKVLCCHGHRYYVKNGLYSLYCAAREQRADICLYGHTHAPVIEEMNGITIVNPGAVCNGEYATIDIIKGKINVIHKKV